jgi:hypothetical protein
MEPSCDKKKFPCCSVIDGFHCIVSEFVWRAWEKLQARQCTYTRNIEVRSFNRCWRRKALSSTYSERVCSVSYPACKARAPYCYLLPAWFYLIFPPYLTNGRVFEEKVILHRLCVRTFCTKFVWNISHSKKNGASCYHKYTRVFL